MIWQIYKLLLCTFPSLFINNIFLAFLIVSNLGLLILVSQRAEVQIIQLFGTERMKSNLAKAMERQRGNAPSILEWIVLIYVIGKRVT